MTRLLREGEQILLIDTKKRRYLLTLTAGKEFHSHSGTVAHDAVIGCPEGTSFRSSHGMYYTVIRPTLSQARRPLTRAWIETMESRRGIGYRKQSPAHAGVA